MALPIIGAAAGGVLAAGLLDRRMSLSHDIRTIKVLLGMMKELAARAEQNKSSVVELFLDAADEQPDKECFVWSSGGRAKSSWTFREMDELTNKLSRWLAEEHGVGKETVVALLFENSPEIYFLEIALLKLGAVPCYINANLRSTSLIHCANISGANLFIVEGPLSREAAVPILNDLRPGMKVYAWGSDTGDSRINVLGEHTFAHLDGKTRLGAEARKTVTMKDPAAIIYTSGTTGLPKAAVVSHQKIAGSATATRFEYSPADRYYQCLPLFHSSGQIGVTIAWYHKTTLIVSRKFSASKFFVECAATNATCFQYIGELCRYLLTPPPNPAVDRGHKATKALGNGLRPDVWLEFRNRFGIETIIEFYGATDTNASLINVSKDDSGVGVVGIQGPLMRRLLGSPVIVKFDVETEMPVRGKNGFCIEADYGEPGEMLGRVPDYTPDAKVFPGYFEGYHGDEKANQKKLLRDVFVKGDLWVRTGDLLKRERNGVVRFVDRIGDTFRWKGENVATTEVANVVGEHPAVAEANVYGVKVANQDGRAGMAAIVLEPSFQDKLAETMEDIGKWTAERLPAYAVPKFVRITKEMEITATLKSRKVEYQKAGFDPAQVNEPMYFFDSDKGTYAPFGEKEYRKVMAGQARL
ncbi:AMP-dependent synthetase and ligase [Hyaloraphidium curvatum]|nr:AMP-dependent synthetase and ligase [Hyaloraphidium curvatum]